MYTAPIYRNSRDGKGFCLDGPPMYLVSRKESLRRRVHSWENIISIDHKLPSNNNTSVVSISTLHILFVLMMHHNYMALK